MVCVVLSFYFITYHKIINSPFLHLKGSDNKLHWLGRWILLVHGPISMYLIVLFA